MLMECTVHIGDKCLLHYDSLASPVPSFLLKAVDFFLCFYLLQFWLNQISYPQSCLVCQTQLWRKWSKAHEWMGPSLQLATVKCPISFFILKDILNSLLVANLSNQLHSIYHRDTQILFQTEQLPLLKHH